MIVLLTGGSGQIGTALLASAPEGLKVIAPDSATLNLADRQSIRAAISQISPDLVINAGAYTAVDNAESEPELAQKINAEAPRVIAEALADRGRGRLLQISTDFVFDGAAAQPYKPDAVRNPLSVYGQTKADGEDAAGDDAIILRTSWVYAAGHANFVRTMLRLMRERDEVRVVADQTGSPSWASEIARGVWALALRDEAGIYHHCDVGQTSWHGFAEAIAEEALELGLLERMPRIEAIATSDYPTPARRPAYSVLDCSVTYAALGSEAPHWRANLRKMLEEEKALG